MVGWGHSTQLSEHCLAHCVDGGPVCCHACPAPCMLTYAMKLHVTYEHSTKTFSSLILEQHLVHLSAALVQVLLVADLEAVLATLRGPHV